MDVSPDKQNIDSLFSNTIYHIDFYQREYKWSDEPVLRLLDDVFYKFNEVYEKNIKAPVTRETIDKYPWYYLNTYITNTIDGNVFIVDGQQRLTTLTIILMKLYHMAQGFDHEKAKDWLKAKIAGQSGFDCEFWMNHEKHKATLQSVYDNQIDVAPTNTGVTALNIVRNYKTISAELDAQLVTLHKFESFVFYFLRRLVLINLRVEQTDVPMVFEVINDRGVKLKPFEILKGKLLGQIDKQTLENRQYNEKWEAAIDSLNSLSSEGADEFFRTFLKAKFSKSRKDGQSFDGDYHRIMFLNSFQDKLPLNRNASGVVDFLDKSFKYYSALYFTALKDYNDDNGDTGFSYNRLLALDGAFLLLLSSCKIDDQEEKEKVRVIPLELDRLYALLQLQNAYDSNRFQEVVYKISEEIRDLPIGEVRKSFDKYILEEISESRNSPADEPFKYAYFKQTGSNLAPRFKRYFFARVEGFLSGNSNNKIRQSIPDLVLKTGAKSGFHIEHILSYNDENLGLFDKDEERFEIERNRLGAILLLKGKDNISSNNESYSEKLKSYSGTLFWNETLREDFYKSKLDISSLNSRLELGLRSMNSFGPEEVEERHNTLFKIASEIWR